MGEFQQAQSLLSQMRLTREKAQGMKAEWLSGVNDFSRVKYKIKFIGAFLVY